ncbi:MAG TPA: hypothetical protein VI757_04895, partial [Bacteroidia bacterium]|nr:hypothetical protein [Bacteroidia bacterium]
YDNQAKYNDAILKTIYYALGGLGTAVLLVFASNWWFNDKKVRDIINEIDTKIKGVKKDTLAELTEKINSFSSEKTSEINQMLIKLQEEVTTTITASTLKFTEFTEKIRAEIKEDNKVLSENYQKQLETFNENYRQQISLLSETINTQHSNLKEILSEEEKKRKDAVNGILQTISRVEFYMWKDSGVFRNAFASLVREMQYKLDKNENSSSFQLALKQLTETLDKCTVLYKGDKVEATDVLNKIPESNVVTKLKQEILAKLEKIKLQKD